jgi:[ribosomal protein S5]-alanine N-acetyltransferase
VIALRTERLTLRPLTRADAPVLASMAGDPRVAMKLADIALPFDETAARAWLKPTWMDVRIGIEREGELIGSISYHYALGAVGGLGYWLGSDHWGKGYAREAAGAVVRHGFAQDRLQRFLSAHFADNPASGRVLTKLGFHPFGRGFDWCQARGEKVEAIYYALQRNEAGFAPARSPWACWLGLAPLRPLSFGSQ